jgi:hypothetical protein
MDCFLMVPLFSEVEQATHLKRFLTPIGPVILENFDEQKHLNKDVPKGEYSSITIGQIDHALMSVAASILTNDPDRTAHDDAL